MPGKERSLRDYLERIPPGHRTTLESILESITSSFPELRVRLAWNVPHVTLGDHYVAGLSSAKEHVAFSPWSTAVLEAHRDRLGDLGHTRNLIRIPPGWTVDHDLIRDLVAARLAELQPAKPESARRKTAKGLPRRPS